MAEVIRAASLGCWPAEVDFIPGDIQFVDEQPQGYQEYEDSRLRDNRVGEFPQSEEEVVTGLWASLTSHFAGAASSGSGGEDAAIPSEGHNSDCSPNAKAASSSSSEDEVPSVGALHCAPFGLGAQGGYDGSHPGKNGQYSSISAVTQLFATGSTPSAPSRTKPALLAQQPLASRSGDQEQRSAIFASLISCDKAAVPRKGASSSNSASTKNWSGGKERWLQKRAAWLGVPLSEVAKEPKEGQYSIDKEGTLQAFQLERLTSLPKRERAEAKARSTSEELGEDSDSDGGDELSDGEAEKVRSAVRRIALFGVELPLKDTTAPFGRPLPLGEVTKLVVEVWRAEEPETFARWD